MVLAAMRRKFVAVALPCAGSLAACLRSGAGFVTRFARVVATALFFIGLLAACLPPGVAPGTTPRPALSCVEILPLMLEAHAARQVAPDVAVARQYICLTAAYKSTVELLARLTDLDVFTVPQAMQIDKLRAAIRRALDNAKGPVQAGDGVTALWWVEQALAGLAELRTYERGL